jgi:hypothetical protein
MSASHVLSKIIQILYAPVGAVLALFYAVLVAVTLLFPHVFSSRAVLALWALGFLAALPEARYGGMPDAESE